MTALLRFGLAGALVALPLAAQAADPAGTPARAAELDVSIPEAPGFAVIDLKPTSVVAPAAQRVTTGQMLGYLDENGNLKPGFAFSVSPYFWARPGVTLDDYRGASPLERVVARIQVSGGFAEGGDSKRDRYGIGFTTELLGLSDYRMNDAIYRCMSRAHDQYYGTLLESRGLDLNAADAAARRELAGDEDFRALLPAEQEARVATRVLELTQAKSAEDRRKIREQSGPAFDKAMADCRDGHQDFAVSKQSLTIAGGMAFRSKGGGPGNETSDGGSFWGAWRLPLADPTLGLDEPAELDVLPQAITAFARYDFDRRTDDAAAPQKFDKITLALVGNYSWRGRLSLGVQAGYEKIDYRGVGPMKDVKSAFYAATATYRLRQGIWVEGQASASRSNPAAPSDQDNKVAINFRFSPTQR